MRFFTAFRMTGLKNLIIKCTNVLPSGLAEKEGDAGLFLEAHATLGFILYELGEFVLALEHTQLGLTFYSQKQRSPYTPVPVQDAGLMCLGFSSWTLWCLGYPGQALKKSQEAFSLAQHLSSPLSQVGALHFAAVLHLVRREPEVTYDHAAAALALSCEQGFLQFKAQETFMKGWRSLNVITTKGSGKCEKG